MNRFRLTLIVLMGLMSSAVMAQDLVSGAGVTITAQDLQSDLLRVPPEVRANTFGRPEMVQNNIANLFVRRAIAAEAVAKGLDKDPVVKAALDLARDRVLSDASLAQLDQASQGSPAALLAYAQSAYKADPKRFEAPEQVRVRHILLRSTEANARQEAEKILQELKAGADFESLAKARSQDPGSATKGGDLGLLARGKTVKPFEDAAFALKQAGSLSDVVETTFGFHIIKLEEKKPATVRGFDEVKDTLIREAQAKLTNQARQRENDRIMATAKFDAQAIEDFAKAQAK